jgi:tetratricopeptide (TPR) repeat protein
VAHYYAGNYAQAVAAFRRVTELQPDFAWGYQMLGTVHHAMGETEPAVAFYRQALELSPDPFAYFNMGNLLYSEERYEEALEAFEQAVALEPREPANHRSLGDTYLKIGRADDARRSWAEAVGLGRERLRVNPEDADEMANLAVCEAKLGHFPSAERHAARAVETAPTHSAVLFHAAVALALAGQPERAVETLQEAVEQGYSPDLIQQDEDLAGLRGLSSYQAVVNQ